MFLRCETGEISDLTASLSRSNRRWQTPRVLAARAARWTMSLGGSASHATTTGSTPPPQSACWRSRTVSPGRPQACTQAPLRQGAAPIGPQVRPAAGTTYQDVAIGCLDAVKPSKLMKCRYFSCAPRTHLPAPGNGAMFTEKRKSDGGTSCQMVPCARR